MSTKTAPAPKATKKPAVNPQHKLLDQAVKKLVKGNSIVPIMEDILFLNGKAVVTDLENYILVPFTVPGLDKIAIPARMFMKTLGMMPEMTAKMENNCAAHFSQSPRKTKLSGDNYENFPKFPFDEDTAYPVIGKLNSEDMAKLKIAEYFISGDDLRPAMTGVYFNHQFKGKKSYICATDAHRLYYEELSTPLEESFILPSKAIDILLAFGGEWEICQSMTNDKHLLCFTREDGLQVQTRAIDARFPDIVAVIPKDKPLVKLFASPDTMISEIKNAMEYANRSTNQVLFSMNGKMKFYSRDVDFGFEYTSEFENKSQFEFAFSKKFPKQYKTKGGRDIRVNKEEGDIALVQFKDENGFYDDSVQVNKSELIEVDPYMNIAFNGKFMLEILNMLPKDTAVDISMWSPTKCAIIDGRFLIMPLMLNS